MTEYEDTFMEGLEKKWAKTNRQQFINRMNRKLGRQERSH